ncbi:hypothetical protein BLS_006857 [Venturia inaequalis]|uniref:Calcineurin-like phosphoesterase domain-containing protein n=1 Tax=Venturia inaequalis TaxID=5025 RepID=A0A8H3UBX2_VENIN|nr:hypothetical protein BLS_006857 [Venturia inaequalis]
MQFARNVYRNFAERPRFQILSDLHLEVGHQYDTYQIPPHAPHLILAGDIGRLIDYEDYLAFLTRHIDRFQFIYLVLGNHEFYGLTLGDGLERAAKLEREKALSNKVIVLHQRRHDIPQLGVIILGCTLWSSIPKEAEVVVAAKINDFKRIVGWSVQDHNAAHQLDLEWLITQVNIARSQIKSRRIVVVTHHAPCIKGTSHPEHTSSDCNSAFATDLLDNGCWVGVNTWVFGHTHYSTAFLRNGIRVIANQRGYVLNPKGENALKKKQEKKKHRFDVRNVTTLRAW